MNTCTPCITSNHSSDPVPPTPFFNLFSCFTPAPHILFYPTSTYPVLGLLPARTTPHILFCNTRRPTDTILVAGELQTYYARVRRIFITAYITASTCYRPCPQRPVSHLFSHCTHTLHLLSSTSLFSGSSPCSIYTPVFHPPPDIVWGLRPRAYYPRAHTTPSHILRCGACRPAPRSSSRRATACLEEVAGPARYIRGFLNPPEDPGVPPRRPYIRRFKRQTGEPRPAMTATARPRRQPRPELPGLPHP
jgi:hypothetical protein